MADLREPQQRIENAALRFEARIPTFEDAGGENRRHVREDRPSLGRNAPTSTSMH